jgi:outer membrane biosynthesis protein TonB
MVTDMDKLFSIIWVLTVALFFAAGALLYRMGRGDLLLDTKDPEAIKASFVMEERKPQAKEAEKPKPKPKPEEKKTEEIIPVNLTKEPEPVKEEAREEVREEPKPEPKPVRQVYGLKKVYSQGLGAAGDAGDAIVGKLGNTLNKAYDTLTATADDLKGKPGQGGGTAPVSSAASVTRYPRLKDGFRSLKPQYSKEMLQNRVEGAVKAKLLIGSDGMVKQVEIISDIGYDSGEIAKAFLMTLQFEPAMKGDQAVSVWIPFSIKFELI